VDTHIRYRSEWLDASIPIRDGMVTWPDNPPVEVTQTSRLDRGDACNVSKLSLGVHTGTHVDAPIHFLEGGHGVDAHRFESLIGPARVVDVGDVPRIDRRVLEGIDPVADERILFRTSNSIRCWRAATFVPDYVFLTPDGARYLVDRGVRTVGIDYLSIGGMTDGAATHHTLLSAPVCVIEGLDLSAIPAGVYDMICLPIRIAGGDGAPARVLLRRLSE
jgi:arylformamidase